MIFRTLWPSATSNHDGLWPRKGGPLTSMMLWPHASRKPDPGKPSSHELAEQTEFFSEQTEISERKDIEKIFPVKKIDVFAG